VGYESLEADTAVLALREDNGRVLVKLAESPFYAEGGGQVSDAGRVETDGGAGRVDMVARLGDDQVILLEPESGGFEPGAAARAVVDRETRLATMANHTATHLLHAALRAELGTHVRQAGSYVGPDKLRFDFTHGERLTAEQAARVEQQVNDWIVASRAVRAVQTTRTQAEELGAMALFGEKYGDVVRMVEVDQVSRELCGGTHVATTAEIGLFHLTHETSSAANVRRIEAVTGPAGIDEFRRRTEQLREISAMLRVPEHEVVAAVRKLGERAKEAAKRPAEVDRGAAEALVAGALEIGGVRVVAEVVEMPDAKALLELSDKVRQTLGDSAVVLGCVVDGKVHLVANFAPAAVQRGLKAGDVVRTAAQITGGGGGGRDTMAQAGGRDPDKLPEAIAAARLSIESALKS
jgi:alanyl-tRNA synthetase